MKAMNDNDRAKSQRKAPHEPTKLDNPTLQHAEQKLDSFIAGYIGCALWSSTDQTREDGGDPLDQNYNDDDISAESRAQITAECSAFLHDNAANIDAYCATNSVIEQADGNPIGTAGHDLWLTRNYHGTGYWDRGAGKIGNALTSVAHALGESDLYVGNDKSLYLSPSDDRMVIIGQAEGIDQHGIIYLDNGPGKFEHISTTDRKLSAALYILANNGDYDEQYGDANGRGCATRIGRFVMVEDMAGFIEVIVYDDTGNASDYAQSFEM